MTQKNEPLITALYERLSRDDDQQGDSNSIVNQKAYLTSYAADHGFAHCRHYTDDGFSGGNFERPGWKQLIADIDAGLVGVVIAKDLSRVGRDYIQTGFYTEVYFRRKGVRFIAIGNGVDTVNPISSEFAPFMNVLNEMYLREQSKKMRTFFRQRGNSGKPTNTLCVYGYRKDPADKNHWLVMTRQLWLSGESTSWRLTATVPTRSLASWRLTRWSVRRTTTQLMTHA